MIKVFDFDLSILQAHQVFAPPSHYHSLTTTPPPSPYPTHSSNLQLLLVIIIIGGRGNKEDPPRLQRKRPHPLPPLGAPLDRNSKCNLNTFKRTLPDSLICDREEDTVVRKVDNAIYWLNRYSFPIQWITQLFPLIISAIQCLNDWRKIFSILAI